MVTLFAGARLYALTGLYGSHRFTGALLSSHLGLSCGSVGLARSLCSSAQNGAQTMRLPDETSAEPVYIRYGRYTTRRLQRAGHAALAADLAKVNRDLRSKYRAAQDLEEPVQDALADRDSVDDGMDGATQIARAAIAGRTTNPAADETYTAIFPMGVAWYIAAPLDEQEPRYKALIARVEKTLPANDHARKALVPVVTQGLKDFEKATGALDKATLAADLGLSGYRSARTAWRRHMDRLYSALRADHGADYAERFFPRVSARGKKTATPAGETLPQG